MELSIARKLISGGIHESGTKQLWADLGAGTGLFTRALSEMLPLQSDIYAVDKDTSSLRKIIVREGINLHLVNKDFVSWSVPEKPDGILMANSLHFVKDQQDFMKTLRKQLRPTGRIVIVEYDLRSANNWVPFPLRFDPLKELAQESGFDRVEKLQETPSAFNRANIYSAVLT